MRHVGFTILEDIQNGAARIRCSEMKKENADEKSGSGL